ncbi:hypothetical protein [Schaalia cardiffensis]
MVPSPGRADKDRVDPPRFSGRGRPFYSRARVDYSQAKVDVF